MSCRTHVPTKVCACTVLLSSHTSVTTPQANAIAVPSLMVTCATRRLYRKMRRWAPAVERIRALTNLRVVPDEGSDTGYRVEIGPFPGWKKLPDW